MLYVPWWEHDAPWADAELYREALANSHQEEANSDFYKCFLCFHSLILSSFLHWWPGMFLKEEEEERG